MRDPLTADRCPVAGGSCTGTSACHAGLPGQGTDRAVILVLRFLAAARDTGDACCWDAALDQAEAAFGERRGPLVVAQAGALIRRLARTGSAVSFLPPPCRRLSSGEALLLDALQRRCPARARSAFGLASGEVAALAGALSPPRPRSVCPKPPGAAAAAAARHGFA